MVDYDPSTIKWDNAPNAAAAPATAPAAAQPDVSGIVWDPVPGSAATASSPAPSSALSGDNPYLANAITGLQNSAGVALGLPNSLARLGDWATSKITGNTDPGFITRHTYSADEINKGLYDASSALNNMVGLPPVTPYTPTTSAGRIGQEILSGAPLALAGGGGIPSLIARQLANATGTTAGDVAHQAYPDSPGVALAASLLGGVAGERALPVAAGIGAKASDAVGQFRATPYAVNKAAASNIVNAAGGTTSSDLVNSIDQNMPNWQISGNTTQPAPTLATVTMNPGLQGLTYRDMPAAEARNNPVYRTNASTTNIAQREAVANATPDISQQSQQAQTTLANQVNALPVGITAQDAGSQFRTGLQSAYDVLHQNRQNVGTAFDALDNSPAQITLSPIKDYAMTQAAQNAGEVGTAYQRAARQFLSGTGIQLDTAPFANSVLKGLNDLSQSYPTGSAAARAVLDVKNRAEQSIFTQAPEIGQARQAYAQASAPLDVFNPSVTPGPIASSIQTTRFGGYTVPNDSVVSQFLTSKGGPDAIDKLTGVFPDVKAATSSLQDYIASQVQQRAINPDGTVNQTALATVLRPYQPILTKGPFADLQRQFSTLDGAQTAVDQLNSRQQLFDKFNTGLGVQARDANNNPMYSAAKFNDFLTSNQGDVVSAFGQAGATRLNQINAQLQDMAQIAAAKVPGQSGTPQALKAGSDNVVGFMVKQALSKAAGAGVGAIFGGAPGALAGEAVGDLIAAQRTKRAAIFDDTVGKIVTNALTDPIFAKSLLTNYNVNQVRPVGQRALDYVKNRLAGVAIPAVQQP